MHKINIKYFTFIEDFNKENIKKLNKKIILIFRNYKENPDIEMLKKLKNFCRENNRMILLSNNIKLAKVLNFDGAYIPSFNKKLINYKIGIKQKFLVVGSAHTKNEIYIKIKQKVDFILLSPIFKIKKKLNYLDIPKFNTLVNSTNKKIIALGGINECNIKRLNMLNINGFASITFFKNKYKLL